MADRDDDDDVPQGEVVAVAGEVLKAGFLQKQVCCDVWRSRGA